MNNQDTQSLLITIGHVTPSGLGPVTVKQGDTVLLVNRFNLLSETARQGFIATLAERYPAIDAEARQRLAQSLTDQAGRLALADASAPPAASATLPDSAALLAAMPQPVRDEAGKMLADPRLLQLIVADIAALGVAGECELTATLYLVGTSRLLDRPDAAIVQGPSSSGKSFIIDKTAELFPPEAVIHATAMTPQALYHLPPGALAHRFVVAGERSRVEDDERAEATRGLREMLSSGKLTKLIPEKNRDQQIETRTIEQAGPIAYVESTTLTKIFEEDANRCIMLQTDERPEQTRRILQRSAQAYRGDAGIDAAAKDGIIQRHHALQRILRPLPVTIPYAEGLANLLSAEKCEARRAIRHTLSMIEAVTLLHQRQRKLDPDDHLIATSDDYAIARQLLRTPMARVLGGQMSDAAARFYEKVIAKLPLDRFTTKDAGRGVSASEQAVRGYLRELSDAGCIELLEPHHGPKPAEWRRTGTEPKQADTTGLPTVEDLFPSPGVSTFRQAPNALKIGV
jgi:hypothetical protein